MKDFVCPKCGFVIKNDIAKKRYLCPTCAKKLDKERNKEHAIRNNELYKKPWLKKPDPEPTEQEKGIVAEAQEKNDAEIDARTREQMKQCRKCDHYAKAAGGYEYCDHVSRTGKLRDRGQGVGQCGSFEPRKPRTNEDRLARARANIIRSESNTAIYADNILNCSKTR